MQILGVLVIQPHFVPCLCYWMLFPAELKAYSPQLDGMSSADSRDMTYEKTGESGIGGRGELQKSFLIFKGQLQMLNEGLKSFTGDALSANPITPT
jgi:hypothetical protein